MKILLTRPLHSFAINQLKKRYTVEVHSGKFPISKTKLLSRIKDKEGLICYPYDKIDSDVINAGSRLRAISTFSVGHDHIDVKAALEKKIAIGYTPEVLTRATADLTMTLILAILRRVMEGDEMIRKNRWKMSLGADEFLGTDLYGKTLGILGMGRIGKAVAKRALGFEMKILYHNRNRLPHKEESKINSRYVSLVELFRKSDVVSIHIPYSSLTHELVNLKLLKEMKATAFLINTARGKILNERDLVTALRRKEIAGAAIDVFQKEPISTSHPLVNFRNVVLTPHIGSATIETRKKMAEITVKNLILALSGKKPLYQVTVESNH